MGACMEPANLCIVTELCPRGNLAEVLKDKNIQLPDQIIYKMAHDTLKGLQFIHNSGLIHRDLKSPNLLIDKYWCVKIADFGLSVAAHNSTDDAQVSLLWTAPEILSRTPNCYSFASDMYSFGIILWELTAKKLPWEGVTPGAITSKVVSGFRPEIPEQLEHPVRLLISAAWAQDAADRPSCKEARTIIENDITPLFGEFDFGSSSSSTFGKVKPSTAEGSLLPAPPPQPPFALVSAYVMGATQLWISDPRMMAEAMRIMVGVFSEYALKLNGYQITQDSPTVIAFANPINAINFCLQTQLALRNCAWPPTLSSYSEAREVSHNAEIIQCGLRVRMGVHWANPTLVKDAVTDRAAYKGPSMQIGAAIARHAQGGLTLIDQEIYNRLMSVTTTSKADPFAINPIGSCVCEGKSIHLFKLAPSSLNVLIEKEMEISGEPEEETKEPWIVPYEEVVLETVIGRGSSGEVYSANCNGKKLVAKKFLQQKMTDEQLLDLRAEFAVLRKLEHTNLVKFEAVCLEPQKLYLFTEYVDRGSLSSMLYADVDIPWTRRIEIARQIASGLAYLHNNDVIHCDVKSPNILITHDWKVKICDFGFQKTKNANQTMTQCGTVAWTAPEIFDGNPHTEKSDVYSYSVILWELIFRKKPWAGKHSMKVIQALEMGNRLPLINLPSETPEFISPIMVECWNQNPEKRYTFLKIVKKLQKAAPAPTSPTSARSFKNWSK